MNIGLTDCDYGHHGNVIHIDRCPVIKIAEIVKFFINLFHSTNNN